MRHYSLCYASEKHLILWSLQWLKRQRIHSVSVTISGKTRSGICSSQPSERAVRKPSLLSFMPSSVKHWDPLTTLATEILHKEEFRRHQVKRPSQYPVIKIIGTQVQKRSERTLQLILCQRERVPFKMFWDSEHTITRLRNARIKLTFPDLSMFILGFKCAQSV